MKCAKVNMGQRRAVHFDHEGNYITTVKIWMTAGVYFEMLKCRTLFAQKSICNFAEFPLVNLLQELLNLFQTECVINFRKHAK